MGDVERFEIARLFQIDPSLLQKIPRSEYRKRRDYWLEVRKLQQPNVRTGPGGVEIEESAWKPEDGAVIVE